MKLKISIRISGMNSVYKRKEIIAKLATCLKPVANQFFSFLIWQLWNRTEFIF